MAPRMPTRESRERAERVFVRRAIEGLSWSAIRDAEGFGSVGAAQTAYRRYLNRNPVPDSRSAMAEILVRKRVTTAQALAAMAEARAEGDHDSFAKLAAVVGREDIELAKMLGLNAPERAEVSVRVTAEDTRARLLAMATERDQAALGGTTGALTIEGELA